MDFKLHVRFGYIIYYPTHPPPSPPESNFLSFPLYHLNATDHPLFSYLYLTKNLQPLYPPASHFSHATPTNPTYSEMLYRNKFLLSQAKRKFYLFAQEKTRTKTLEINPLFLSLETVATFHSTILWYTDKI